MSISYLGKKAEWTLCGLIADYLPVFPSYDGIVPKVRNLRHRIFPPSHGDDKAVARRGKWTDCDSQAGSIPACHIVQFSDRTQLAMTPSDTGRASSNRSSDGRAVA